MATFKNLTISAYKTIQTKANQEMVFCSCIYEGQQAELIVFPNMNKEIKEILSKNHPNIPITIYGEKRIQENGIQIIVERIEQIKNDD